MNADQTNRMKELIQEISKASYAYYVLDNPYISDMQWDRLYDELRSLEAETGVVLPDSPTRKVGGETCEDYVSCEFAVQRRYARQRGAPSRRA